MSILILVFNFIVSIPKIWAIFNEVVQWIEARKNSEREQNKQEARRDVRKAPTQKEREDAADKFLDNVD
jgi:hypothetical protein